MDNIKECTSGNESSTFTFMRTLAEVLQARGTLKPLTLESYNLNPKFRGDVESFKKRYETLSSEERLSVKLIFWMISVRYFYTELRKDPQNKRLKEALSGSLEKFHALLQQPHAATILKNLKTSRIPIGTADDIVQNMNPIEDLIPWPIHITPNKNCQSKSPLACAKSFHEAFLNVKECITGNTICEAIFVKTCVQAFGAEMGIPSEAMESIGVAEGDVADYTKEYKRLSQKDKKNIHLLLKGLAIAHLCRLDPMTPIQEQTLNALLLDIENEYKQHNKGPAETKFRKVVEIAVKPDGSIDPLILREFMSSFISIFDLENHTLPKAQRGKV